MKKKINTKSDLLAMKRSTLLHLRIPFSFFLLPFFVFAASQSGMNDLFRFFLVFISLHLFLYPASNGFNSYFDKDEESIGGLKTPPKVERELLWVSLFFDLTALVLGWLVCPEFAVMLFVYGLASKAYSYPGIRLKKYPFGGLITVVFFQGFFTYLLAICGLERLSFPQLLEAKYLIPASLCSFLLLGSYPMTQVYQHAEDGRRGDRTLSLLLGVRGTFVWTALIFMATTGAFVYYFQKTYSFQTALVFPLFLAPVLLFFLFWAYRVFQNEKNADWKSTMRLNMLSSVCFLAFFSYLMFFGHQ